MNQWLWGTIIVVTVTTACSFSAGGWQDCFLDHTNLELSVQHAHGDPNAP